MIVTMGGGILRLGWNAEQRNRNMVDQAHKPVYWLSPVGTHDDFGGEIDDEIIDAKTRMGPWALMNPESWSVYRASTMLGTGYGQRYKKQPDGKWLKVEG